MGGSSQYDLYHSSKPDGVAYELIPLWCEWQRTARDYRNAGRTLFVVVFFAEVELRPTSVTPVAHGRRMLDVA